jgi:hypothetical protein
VKAGDRRSVTKIRSGHGEPWTDRDERGPAGQLTGVDQLRFFTV